MSATSTQQGAEAELASAPMEPEFVNELPFSRRATKDEMERRSASILDLARQDGQVDATTVTEKTSLSYQQSFALLAKMETDGLLRRMGRQNRRVIYKTVPPSAKPQARTPIKVAKVVEHLHLGQRFQVTGLALEDGRSVISLDDEGETIRVALVAS